jgi:hypothetical protein
MFGKGQALIVFSLMIVMLLVTLRISANPRVQDEIVFKFNLILAKKQFENVKSEILKSADIAARSNQIEKTKDFLVYLKNNLGLEILWVLVKVPKVNAGTSTTLNVTITNLEKNSLSNLSLTFSYDNSSKLKDYLAPGETWQTSFDFISSEDTNYALFLSYVKGEEEVKKNLEIPIKMNKSSIATLFNLIYEPLAQIKLTEELKGKWVF